MIYFSSPSENTKLIQNLIDEEYPTFLSSVNLLEKRFPNIGAEVNWFKRAINYNIHRGRFLATVFLFSYMNCETPERLTTDIIKSINTCGLCLEAVSKEI